MKTAIIVSSKYGTTKKIANVIVNNLHGKVDVDLIYLNTDGNIDVSYYDTVVLGTSIYAGKPRQPIARFCEKNKDVLVNKKLYLYVCGMDKANADKEMNMAYPQLLLDHSSNTKFFEGEYQLDKMSFFDRTLLRVFFNVKKPLSRDYGQEVQSFLNELN